MVFGLGEFIKSHNMYAMLFCPVAWSSLRIDPSLPMHLPLARTPHEQTALQRRSLPKAGRSTRWFMSYMG